jgi:phosphoribosylformylglycinamidine synthase
VLVDLDKLFKKKKVSFDLHEIDLFSASDKELQGISDRLGIALNVDEMKRIREYFKGKNRNPNDIELEALGQAWSEHCCYKSSKVPLKEYVFGIEEKKFLLKNMFLE